MLLVGVFAIAFGWFFQGFGPAPQPAPVINTTTTVNLVAPPPDPEVVAETSVTSSQAIVVQVAAPLTVEWANDILKFPDVWRTTPPELSYEMPKIRELAQKIQLAALGLLALFLFAHAGGHALGQESNYPRIVFATILCIGNLIWWEIGIRINNAIAQEIGAPNVDEMMRPLLVMPVFEPGEAIGRAVLTAIYAGIGILMMVNLIFRLGLIDVLIVVGPLAHMCAAIPETDSWSTTYNRMSVGLLFSQVMINIGFATGGALGAATGGSIWMAIVVLLLVRRLPSLVSTTGNSAPSRGIFAMFSALALRRLRLR